MIRAKYKQSDVAAGAKNTTLLLPTATQPTTGKEFLLISNQWVDFSIFQY